MNARVERVMKAIGKLQLDDIESLAEVLSAQKPAVAREIARWVRAELPGDWPAMPGQGAGSPKPGESER